MTWFVHECLFFIKRRENESSFFFLDIRLEVVVWLAVALRVVTASTPLSCHDLSDAGS